MPTDRPNNPQRHFHRLFFRHHLCPFSFMWELTAALRESQTLPPLIPRTPHLVHVAHTSTSSASCSRGCVSSLECRTVSAGCDRYRRDATEESGPRLARRPQRSKQGELSKYSNAQPAAPPDREEKRGRVHAMTRVGTPRRLASAESTIACIS